MFLSKSNDRVKKIVVYTVAAAFVLSTGVIGITALVSRRSEPVPTANAADIAVVNGQGIGYSEFLERYQYTYQQYPFFSPGESEYWLRSFVLDQIIAGELLRTEAEKASIEVDKASVDEIIESQKAMYSDERDYDLYLKSRGLTEEDMRDAVRSSLMVEKYIEQIESAAVVSDEEIATEFERRKADDESLVFEEIEETIRGELLEKKKNELLINHIDELKAGAQIEIKDPVIKAIRASEQEDYETAAEYYKEAIEEYGVDPYLHIALGRALDRLDDSDGALVSYQKAAEVDEDVNPEVQLVLGTAYNERGMTEEAAEAFRKASEIDGETDAYLHTILKSEFEEMGLSDDVAREQDIIDRIAEATAKMQEEYEKQLQELQQAQESEQSAEEGDSTSDDSADAESGDSAASEGDGQTE